MSHHTQGTVSHTQEITPTAALPTRGKPKTHLSKKANSSGVNCVSRVNQKKNSPQGASPAQPVERPTVEHSRFRQHRDVCWRVENWQSWSWKIKTAVSGSHVVLADVMTASETGEDRTHDSQQRIVELAGQEHGVGSQECDGTAQRTSVG